MSIWKTFTTAMAAIAALLLASIATAETLESNYAIIEFDEEDATLALIVADAIDQVYGEMFIFFSQINGMAPDPQKVPVNMSSLYLDWVQFVNDEDNPALTESDGSFTIDIDPDEISGLDQLRSIAVHELFHHLSYRSGTAVASDLNNAANYWVLEGTAIIAEYYFNTPNEHREEKLKEYLQKTAFHQNVGIVDASHHAALFVLYMMRNSGDSFRQIVTQFSATHDGEAVAQNLAIEQYWQDFTKKMFNREPIQPISVNGGPLKFPSGDNFHPFSDGPVYDIPQQGVVQFDVVMPALSWQEGMLNVPGGLKWFTVHFGDLGDEEDFIVHAFLKDKDTDQYRYEDWTGEKFRRVCNSQDGPCKGKPNDNVSKVALILANKSADTDLDGLVVAGSLDKKWKLQEIQLSETMKAPAVDELILEFGTGGGMSLKSKGWWLKVPHTSYPSNPGKLTYKFINEQCRFKGAVKFRRDMEKEEVTYDEDKGAEKIIWETTRIETEGIFGTPMGWWCDFIELQQTLTAAGGISAGAAVARVFTDLNTSDYPPGSFARNLSNVMKGMMSMQVPRTGQEDVTMYHIVKKGEPRRLQVEIQGNVRAWFLPVAE